MHKTSLWTNLDIIMNVVGGEDLIDIKILEELTRSVLEIDIEYVFDFLDREEWDGVGGGRLIEALINVIGEDDNLLNYPNFRCIVSHVFNVKIDLFTQKMRYIFMKL